VQAAQQQRVAETIDSIVALMKELQRRRAFNALLGVVSGISNAAVSQLSLNNPKLRNFIQLLDPLAGWPKYNELLNSDTQLPTSPFVGALVSKFSFMIDNEQVVDELVGEIERWQNNAVKWEPDWLADALVFHAGVNLTEEQIFNHSRQILVN
jgi:hypothetical protein